MKLIVSFVLCAVHLLFNIHDTTILRNRYGYWPFSPMLRKFKNFMGGRLCSLRENRRFLTQNTVCLSYLCGITNNPTNSWAEAHICYLTAFLGQESEQSLAGSSVARSVNRGVGQAAVILRPN